MIGEIHMSVNKFTEDEIKELRKNPYVVCVSDKSINYSEDFKELFWIDYQNGLAPSKIFSKYGFDPDVLGIKRRTNFVYRLKAEANRIDKFKDKRKDSSGRPVTKDLTPDEKIDRLTHKVNVLQQENDFLKRVRFINRKQISKMQKKNQQ